MERRMDGRMEGCREGRRDADGGMEGGWAVEGLARWVSGLWDQWVGRWTAKWWPSGGEQAHSMELRGRGGLAGGGGSTAAGDEPEAVWPLRSLTCSPSCPPTCV